MDLGFVGPPGARVRFTEMVAGVPTTLAQAITGPGGFVPLLRAVTWRCDRLSRQLGATTIADGTLRRTVVEVRTPSCAGRLAVTVPRHVGARGVATCASRTAGAWATAACASASAAQECATAVTASS